MLNPPNIGNSSSKLDFPNMQPLTSDLIAELQVVDSHTGEFLLKFHFVWTFDVVSNRPLI